MSPIGAAMKNQQQAVGSTEIRQRSQRTALIGKGEIGDALAGFGPGSVGIVGCAHMRGVQLFGDRFAGVSPPSELPHDRRFFRQIGRYLPIELLWSITGFLRWDPFALQA